MPFIIQCPHPDCQKYVLLEDQVRGTPVKCLLCDQPILLEGDEVGERTMPPPLSQSADGHSTPIERQEITPCPVCTVPLRLPKSSEGKSIRCPACKEVFQG